MLYFMEAIRVDATVVNCCLKSESNVPWVFEKTILGEIRW